MRISVNITDYSWPEGATRLGAQLARVLRAADAGGLDTVWVPDHLIQAAPGSTADSEMLEAYTTLGFLAGQSTRIRLGTMVTAATYRAPALLVKAVTTLDVLSGGRAWLGIGAGYHEGEALAMGLSLPATGERYERLEETLRIALQMWAGDTTAFAGARHRLDRPVCSPQPLSRPHPPILMGGMGERKTLRLVAQYADACNLFDIPDGGATIRRKLAVLAEHCDAIGRPCQEIEKTVSTRLEPGESPGAFAERCAALAALGIEHAVVISSAPWSEERIAVLASAVTA
jgi:F420-dependent oxidoreductase-like protein